MEKTRKREIHNPFSTSEKFKRATSPFLLNGYDSAILEDRAYLKITDEILRLEYQISNIEDDLIIIDEEIIAATSIDDKQREAFLRSKKAKLERTLKELNEQYYSLGPMSKITSFISSFFRKKPKNQKNIFQKISFAISKYILANVSKRLKFTFDLKLALEKLSNINKSVDELISLQMPMGEINSRYDKLSSYINKANDIHSNITQNVSTFSGEHKKLGEAGKFLDITR